MAAEVELWHNPRCSKSREALALLEGAGAEVELRRYLDQPPDEEELERTLRALNLEPWEIARSKDPAARELDLPGVGQQRRRWIELLTANPKLIERPIAIAGDRAALGRPPERVLDLLEDG